MKKHRLDEKEMELVKLLMADCETTGDTGKAEKTVRRHDRANA